MEGIVKKYQQKFKKVREEMDRWDDLQRRLLSLFSNASSIILRLQVIGDKKYYGGLKGVHGIEEAVLQKQMESLETILLSINKTMEEFQRIVSSLEKMVRDSKQQVQGGSHRLSYKQLQLKIGVKPSLSDCIDGLSILQEMHKSEYLLKTSVISALMKTALRPSFLSSFSISSDLPILISLWRLSQSEVLLLPPPSQKIKNSEEKLMPLTWEHYASFWLISLIFQEMKCNSSLTLYLPKTYVEVIEIISNNVYQEEDLFLGFILLRKLQ